MNTSSQTTPIAATPEADIGRVAYNAYWAAREPQAGPPMSWTELLAADPRITAMYEASAIAVRNHVIATAREQTAANVSRAAHALDRLQCWVDGAEFFDDPDHIEVRTDDVAALLGEVARQAAEVERLRAAITSMRDEAREIRRQQAESPTPLPLGVSYDDLIATIESCVQDALTTPAPGDADAR